MQPKPESKQQAFNLYFQTDLPQSRIAELLDVNRKTVYLWVKEGQWEYLKKSARQMPGVLLDQFSRQLVSLNESILDREDRPFPTKEEADIQRKLSLTIKNLRKGPDPSERLAEMVRFVELLKGKDDDMAMLKELIPTITEFNGQIVPDVKTYTKRTKAQYHEDLRGRQQDREEAAQWDDDDEPQDPDPPETNPGETLSPATELPPEINPVSPTAETELVAPAPRISGATFRDHVNQKNHCNQGSDKQDNPEPPPATSQIPPNAKHILKSGVAWMGRDIIYDPATGKQREMKGYELNEIATIKPAPPPPVVAAPVSEEKESTNNNEAETKIHNENIRRRNEEYKAAQQALAQSVLASERYRHTKDKNRYCVLS